MRPVVWHDEAKQRLDHRALAGAVGTEQSHGSRGERGADILKGPLRSVHDGDAVERDDGIAISHSVLIYVAWKTKGPRHNVPRRPNASA